MEMCYSGALVMPSCYAVMDEEEMMYLEGGAASKASVAGIICSAFGISGGMLGLIQGWIGVKTATTIATLIVGYCGIGIGVCAIAAGIAGIFWACGY